MFISRRDGLWNMGSLVTIRSTLFFPKQTRQIKRVCEPRGKLGKVKMIVPYDTKDIAVQLQMD